MSTPTIATNEPINTSAEKPDRPAGASWQSAFAPSRATTNQSSVVSASTPNVVTNEAADSVAPKLEGDTPKENPKETPSISSAKIEANRKNAQQSTGPNTEVGKRRSSGNALKHGLLSTKEVVVQQGKLKEDSSSFEDLLDGLCHDFEPVGTLELQLVQQLAICIWRGWRALRFEARLAEVEPLLPMDDAVRWLPSQWDLCRLVRYEAANNRHLARVLNQLERLQRARKGENVPPPITMEVSTNE